MSARVLELAVLGATGRMGRAVLAAMSGHAWAKLRGALAAPGDPALGRDAGTLAGSGGLGVEVTDRAATAVAGADVAIDFTLPAATAQVLEACEAAGCGLVTGVTGLDAGLQSRVAAAAGRIPIVQAPNMSVGVNLMFELAALAARVLDSDFDAEIVEAHHRYKADAPSGTALKLAAVIAGARRGAAPEAFVPGRRGLREAGSIGLASVRGGDLAGDHTLHFLGDGERLEITHRAGSRAGFAEGALRAARWVAGRPPGLYGMEDVLGLRGRGRGAASVADDPC